MNGVLERDRALLSMIIALLLYAVLGGTYLLVMPALTILYLKQRWYDASSIERLLMYFCVFLFFPGILILSPILNFRPQPRQIN